MGRRHWLVTAQPGTFTPSARALHDPDRGFYRIQGFRITDDRADFHGSVAAGAASDPETALSLVEINLADYVKGPISEQGLENTESLFKELESTGRRFIIRFVYDWDGRYPEVEPRDVSIIAGHMGQLREVLQRHAGCIFTLQGLFFGNWGEMNGSRYTTAAHMRTLAEALAEAAPQGVWLAVRTPLQWRMITGAAAGADWMPEAGSLAARIGLFNDGMLGSEQDYGTYGSQTPADGLLTAWTREDELAFQNRLCRFVPNGGEVIVDNRWNDFDTAAESLARMHVTYLNRGYDTAVLEKWAAATVHSEDCFDGMDGLTWMERHLGYRLRIGEARADYSLLRDTLTVKVRLHNDGFAPVYADTVCTVSLTDLSGRVLAACEMPQELRTLSGGETLDLQCELPVSTLEAGEYRLYFSAVRRMDGVRLEMANEENQENAGSLLATVQAKGRGIFR